MRQGRRQQDQYKTFNEEGLDELVNWQSAYEFSQLSMQILAQMASIQEFQSTYLENLAFVTVYKVTE